MSSLYVGDTGKTLRVGTGYDMSSYTELSLVFTKPDGTVVTKTTSDGVALGGVAVTDPDIGALSANEYITYDIEPGLLDVGGRWCVHVIYTNTTATPDDIFYGAPARFTVKELC